MKAYGIIFNNFKISNTWDLSAEKYSVLSIGESALPTCTYASFIAPKRDGSTSYRNRYEDKEIEMVIEVRGKNPIKLANNVTALLAHFVGVKSKLIMLNRPNLYYVAEILDEIKKTETKKGTVELTIIFKASYCRYGLRFDETDFTNELPLRYTLNEGSSVIYNEGNYIAKPILEITGIANTVTIQIANKTFSIANLNGTIFIDSENMIVYKIVNSKKVSCLQQFRGVFPDIQVGLSEVKIIGNISVKIKYRDTYIY